MNGDSYSRIPRSTLRLRHFNIRLVMRVTGLLLLVLASSMLLPVAVSWHCGDGAHLRLLAAMAAILVLGLLLRNVLGHDPDYVVSDRESYWITCLVWLIVPAAGALPYLLTGGTASVTDALFESFSGFTTTGSSVLSARLDSLPRGLLVWRSMTQWLGGLGLVLFVIAVLKKLNVAGVTLYDTEYSGTVQRKLHPRIAITVGYMWKVYILVTLLLLAALLLCGNGLFDSFCLTLSTVSTGGFFAAEAGLAGFSMASQMVLAAFMLLCGTNMALLYYLVTGHGGELWRDREWRLFAGVFVGVAALFVLLPMGQGMAWQEALTDGLFHTASLMSTTGFALGGERHWPVLLSVLAFVLVLTGAMSGSTGGGLKWKRLMILAQYVRNYLVLMLHPNAVHTIRINNRLIGADYLNKVLVFVFLFIFFMATGAFVLMVCGMDIPTSFAVAAANLSNMGPATLLGDMGAAVDYAALPRLAKWTLMALMLLGRVEIFAFVAILSPAYWRRG